MNLYYVGRAHAQNTTLLDAVSGGGATPGGVVGKSVMLEWGTQEPD